MFQYKTLRPILWTRNLQESIDFYTEILDFSIGERNDDWQWASLFKDKVEIMLSAPNSHSLYEKIGFTGSFYFNVNNVDELWEDLKSKTKICYDIENFDWGMREFAIYDNNNYILQFGQDIPNFLKEE